METFNQNTEMLEPMRRAHASAGIFLDFDGTMAEIVGRPEAARPFPGLGSSNRLGSSAQRKPVSTSPKNNLVRQ